MRLEDLFNPDNIKDERELSRWIFIRTAIVLTIVLALLGGVVVCARLVGPLTPAVKAPAAPAEAVDVFDVNQELNQFLNNARKRTTP